MKDMTVTVPEGEVIYDAILAVATELFRRAPSRVVRSSMIADGILAAFVMHVIAETANEADALAAIRIGISSLEEYVRMVTGIEPS